jgi:hypothetical protein
LCKTKRLNFSISSYNVGFKTLQYS